MSGYNHESPQQKQNRKDFKKFSKALTGSVASRLARRDQKSSISSIRTEHYMREADHYIKTQNLKVVKQQQPLPPRFYTLLAQQIRGGECKGQWNKTAEMVELMGGFVPDPPKGIEEWRWWTALGMAFIRRHPHLWTHTRAAYEKAEFWVSDVWLLRTARDMLPPLDGTFKDFIGRQSKSEMNPNIAAQIRAGQWRQPVVGALEERGYMAFTWDMKGRNIRDTNTLAHAAPGEPEHIDIKNRKRTIETAGGTRRLVGTANTGPRSPEEEERGFTAQAAQALEESMNAAGKKFGRTWKTDDEINEIARRKDRQIKREKEFQKSNKALNREFDLYLSRPGKDFHLNDPVTTRWRATSNYDLPKQNKIWYSAKVIKVYTDGCVDVKLLDERGETYKRVDKKHVRINRVELAILSAQESIAKGNTGDDNNNNGDDNDNKSGIDLFRARQERGGGPARRHAGIDALCEQWTNPLSTRKETKRLSKYLVDKRPDFSTRLQNVAKLSLRRDRSLLDTMPIDSTSGLTPKEEREKKRAAIALAKSKSMPSLDDLMREDRENALEAELRAATPSAIKETRVSVGSVRGEVALKMAQAKQKKEIAKRRKILKNVVQSEEILALAMLTYEDQLVKVKQALSDAIDMHKTAALQTEQIHAFDPVTSALNDTRWITCELVEAIVEWRLSKIALGQMDPALLGKAYEIMKAITNAYDPLEDPDKDDMGELLHPGAMPFLWGGENVLLSILSGLDFLTFSNELTHWYGSNFEVVSNPFMLVTPISNRAHTPRKFTQTIMVNGEEIEHEVPRLKELASKAVKKLRETKDRQFNCSFWWPGNDMRPAEFERARRAEKEIVQELRREKLRNVQTQKDLEEKLAAQKQEMEDTGMGF